MRTLLLLPCLLWAAYAGAQSVNLPDIHDSLGRAPWPSLPFCVLAMTSSQSAVRLSPASGLRR